MSERGLIDRNHMLWNVDRLDHTLGKDQLGDLAQLRIVVNLIDEMFDFSSSAD
jgi:hypothetical protein